MIYLIAVFGLAWGFFGARRLMRTLALEAAYLALGGEPLVEPRGSALTRRAEEREIGL